MNDNFSFLAADKSFSSREEIAEMIQFLAAQSA
jgi:hypothetical protein